MAIFPSSIILTVEEALDIVAALDDAAEVVTDPMLAFELDGARRIVSDKLTEAWPDRGE